MVRGVAEVIRCRGGPGGRDTTCAWLSPRDLDGKKRQNKEERPHVHGLLWESVLCSCIAIGHELERRTTGSRWPRRACGNAGRGGRGKAPRPNKHRPGPTPFAMGQREGKRRRRDHWQWERSHPRPPSQHGKETPGTGPLHGAHAVEAVYLTDDSRVRLGMEGGVQTGTKAPRVSGRVRGWRGRERDRTERLAPWDGSCSTHLAVWLKGPRNVCGLGLLMCRGVGSIGPLLLSMPPERHDG